MNTACVFVTGSNFVVVEHIKQIFSFPCPSQQTIATQSSYGEKGKCICFPHKTTKTTRVAKKKFVVAVQENKGHVSMQSCQQAFYSKITIVSPVYSNP